MARIPKSAAAKAVTFSDTSIEVGGTSSSSSRGRLRRSARLSESGNLLLLRRRGWKRREEDKKLRLLRLTGDQTRLREGIQGEAELSEMRDGGPSSASLSSALAGLASLREDEVVPGWWAAEAEKSRVGGEEEMVSCGALEVRARGRGRERFACGRRLDDAD